MGKERDLFPRRLCNDALCARKRDWHSGYMFVKMKNLQAHPGVPVTREDLGKEFVRRI